MIASNLATTAAALLLAQSTDFGVRTPPGEPQSERGWVRTDRPPNRGFSCVVRYVTDGDTFRCSNGTRVRLSSIDTPEMPGSCRQGRACAPGDPYAAKAALQRLIGGGRSNASRWERAMAAWQRGVRWAGWI